MTGTTWLCLLAPLSLPLAAGLYTLLEPTISDLLEGLAWERAKSRSLARAARLRALFVGQPLPVHADYQPLCRDMVRLSIRDAEDRPGLAYELRYPLDGGSGPVSVEAKRELGPFRGAASARTGEDGVERAGSQALWEHLLAGYERPEALDQALLTLAPAELAVGGELTLKGEVEQPFLESPFGAELLLELARFARHAAAALAAPPFAVRFDAFARGAPYWSKGWSHHLVEGVGVLERRTARYLLTFRFRPEPDAGRVTVEGFCDLPQTRGVALREVGGAELRHEPDEVWREVLRNSAYADAFGNMRACLERQSLDLDEGALVLAGDASPSFFTSHVGWTGLTGVSSVLDRLLEVLEERAYEPKAS
ncbi:MAG: hypothetical protein AB7N76_15665 [Planctomycetota bacterium]